MRLISRLRDRRFCAFCKTERRVYCKRHIDMTNVLGSALLSGAVSMAFFGQTDPRGIVLFCLLCVLGEMFVFMRWRVNIVCKMCGFDPVLYKRSPPRAAARVREFFQEQVKNPKFQLSNSPLLDLHRRMKVAERKTLERTLAFERKRAGLRSPVVPGKGAVVDPKGP